MLERKDDEAFMLKVWPKKPFVIGALKFGFTQAADAAQRAEGDDAYMEVQVWLNWNNRHVCQRVATVKVDSLFASDVSLEDLDKQLKLQRTDGDKMYCGEAFFLQFKVKGEKGRDHFKNFKFDLLKFYM